MSENEGDSIELQSGNLLQLVNYICWRIVCYQEFVRCTALARYTVRVSPRQGLAYPYAGRYDNGALRPLIITTHCDINDEATTSVRECAPAIRVT